MARRREINDPNFEREAQKYDRPIPSREYIMERLADVGVPMTLEELAQALELSDDDDLEALRRRLKAMERDGQLMRNRRGGYGLVQKMDLVRGRVIGHPDGFGFLVPDDGGNDLFLSARQMRTLMHDDRAVVQVVSLDRKGRREGAVVEVLERANHQLVGRFHIEHDLGFVIPANKHLNQDIIIPPDLRGGAVDNQIVVVEIVEQPTTRTKPLGKVIEVLGDHMAPGMEIDVAIRSYSLPEQWPEEVLAEVSQLREEVPEEAKAGREDLRKLPLVTIDGEDARDFDDAVYCEPHGSGWRLIVAIADVSSYVKPGTALDAEALTRGNSVYFPQRVVPMLPEVLSNGLCSLNPQVDRLCLACELFITATGSVRRYRFMEAVMRSTARLTYTNVAALVVDRDAGLRAQHEDLTPHLDNLFNLYEVLRTRRSRRGAIDFETTETRIIFGPERKIERIVPVVRNEAHRLIEECMLAANVAAAEFLSEAGLPVLYRIHAGPTEEKLADLREFLAEMGLRLGGGDDPEPKHYAKLLDQVRGRPDAALIQTVLLRSLSQAVYSPETSGHFGLAYDVYTHYTSPIRRYPDLLVHRAIRHKLAGLKDEAYAYTHMEMANIGDHCSRTERRADEATRDTVDWLKCEYMLEKVGEEYEGVITTVTSFGLFVALIDIYVEGLVHVTALKNDYYHFDPVKRRLEGERTRTIYRLGDRVRVRVVRVDLDERKLDFELAASPAEHQPRDEKAGSKRRRRKK